MFGHLKGEEFVNLMEGIQLPGQRKLHLDGCAQCTATWTSMLAMQTDMTSLDADIPEPDWAQFRSSVRDELLSRSMKRDSSVRRWTGWAVRPATAWAFSLLLAVGITTGAFLWKLQPASNLSTVSETPATTVTTESIEVEGVRASLSNAALFDDLVQLGDAEEEQLRAMLTSAQKGSQYQQ